MFDYKNKQRNIDHQIAYMYSRSLNMFNYLGLPETIPKIEIEKILQKKGYGFVTEHEGSLYIFNGGLGGLLDPYDNPTEINVSNPALKLNKTFNIETDGVLIKNDDLMMGLDPIYQRYVYMMIENEISMIMDSYNKRIQTLISAPDDNTKASADLYLKKIIDGDLTIVGENPIFDGIKTHNAQSNMSGSITQMVEYHQYLKASLYNEIGLNANFNMKRERLSASETNLNVEALYPLIDDMLECRQDALNKINDRYDLDITIEFAGVWQRRQNSLSEVDPDDLVEVDPDDLVDPDDPDDPVDPDDLVEVIDDLIETVDDLEGVIEDEISDIE